MIPGNNRYFGTALLFLLGVGVVSSSVVIFRDDWQQKKWREEGVFRDIEQENAQRRKRGLPELGPNDMPNDQLWQQYQSWKQDKKNNNNS